MSLTCEFKDESGATAYLLSGQGMSANWVYDVSQTRLLSSESYAQERIWRQWLGQAGRARRGVPHSTFFIKNLLVHSTKNRNLESISRAGLLTSRSGQGGLGGGDQSGKYVNRDGYLGAVWLATSSSVGREMRGNIEDYELFDIIVKVPEFFREFFMRDINAVLHDNMRTSGTTILCFNDIPPEFLFYRDRHLQLRPLRELDFQAVLREQEAREAAAAEAEELDEEFAVTPSPVVAPAVTVAQRPQPELVLANFSGVLARVRQAVGDDEEEETDEWN